MPTELEQSILNSFEEHFRDTSEGHMTPLEGPDDYSSARQRERDYFKTYCDLDYFIQEVLSQSDEFRKELKSLLLNYF